MSDRSPWLRGFTIALVTAGLLLGGFYVMDDSRTEEARRAADEITNVQEDVEDLIAKFGRRAAKDRDRAQRDRREVKRQQNVLLSALLKLARRAGISTEGLPPTVSRSASSNPGGSDAPRKASGKKKSNKGPRH